MPWTKNPNEEDVYVPSIYSKDDLPTWDELFRWYNMMVDNKWDYFNTKFCKTNNAYWNIPEELFLCTVCCNQLNKMLHEDGLLDDEQFIYAMNVLLEDNELMKSGYKVLNMTFNPFFTDLIETTDKYIYSVKADPIKDFLTRKNDYSYKPMKEYNGLFGLSIAICVQKERDVESIKVTLDADIKHDIVTLMLKDVLEYFDGKVGWKDIESNNEPAINCPSGYDPAL